MSEQAPKNQETLHSSHENPHRHENLQRNHENAHEASAEQQTETLKKLRNEVAHNAISSKESSLERQNVNKNQTPQLTINKELKNLMFDRTLTKVQKHLSPVSRSFSKIIHKNTVDKISSVGEKTIARPIGILGGGLFALLGSIFSTYLSKQFGLKYNFLAFVLLFIVGYAVASMLELLYLLLFNTKKH